MQQRLERRIAALPATNVSVTPDSRGGFNVSGLAVPYNSEAIIGRGPKSFREVVRRGAFSRALRERQNVALLGGHDSAVILARVGSGTLTLHDSLDGLRFAGSIIPSPIGTHWAMSVARGDTPGVSMGFFVPDNGDKWTKFSDGSYLRELTDIDLGEISLVGWPAYQRTSVSTVADPVFNEDDSAKLALTPRLRIGVGEAALCARLARLDRKSMSVSEVNRRLKLTEARLQEAIQ